MYVLFSLWKRDASNCSFSTKNIILYSLCLREFLFRQGIAGEWWTMEWNRWTHLTSSVSHCVYFCCFMAHAFITSSLLVTLKRWKVINCWETRGSLFEWEAEGDQIHVVCCSYLSEVDVKPYYDLWNHFWFVFSTQYIGYQTFGLICRFLLQDKIQVPSTLKMEASGFAEFSVTGNIL